MLEQFLIFLCYSVKTGPSLTEAAMGMIAQGTKVIAEGGYEKIFRQTFETLPEEHLKKSYACYLSTSAGPVMGILYLSSAKLAFCSDNPLSCKSEDKTEWSYYKVNYTCFLTIIVYMSLSIGWKFWLIWVSISILFPLREKQNFSRHISFFAMHMYFHFNLYIDVHLPMLIFKLI